MWENLLALGAPTASDTTAERAFARNWATPSIARLSQR